MKQRVCVTAIIIVLFIGAGFLSPTYITKRAMNQTTNPENIKEVIDKTPPKLVGLLKMPTKFPFTVSETKASIDNLLPTEGSNDRNKEIEEEDTKSLPYDQVTYEQTFFGDNIHVSILANAQEVEMVYADPTDVKEIQLNDGSAADYIDYGFNQQIVWKDSETEVTYIINVNLPDEKGTGKFIDQEIIEMIDSFKDVKQ